MEASRSARINRPRGYRRHRPTRKRSWVLPVVACLFVGGAVFLDFGFPLIGCNVKGNISYNTGEHIYHVPGQYYYAVTRIDWFKGERWFCSEDAARAAGWRKSKR